MLLAKIQAPKPRQSIQIFTTVCTKHSIPLAIKLGKGTRSLTGTPPRSSTERTTKIKCQRKLAQPTFRFPLKTAYVQNINLGSFFSTTFYYIFLARRPSRLVLDTASFSSIFFYFFLTSVEQPSLAGRDKERFQASPLLQ